MKKISFDVTQMRADRREEMVEWVRGLGLEPNDLRPQILIRMAARGYELHLSRFVRDEAGKLRLDLAANEVVSEPLVVDLGTEQTWPAWLNQEFSR